MFADAAGMEEEFVTLAEKDIDAAIAYMTKFVEQEGQDMTRCC